MPKELNMARRIVPLIDLTSLNEDDTNDIIINLCKNTETAVGTVAAVCIYPKFVPLAKKFLAQQNTRQVQVATVVNFPAGNSDIDVAVAETRAAIAYGADEIDVVFPYRAFALGDSLIGAKLIKACKSACLGKLLKVIIESGELKHPTLIKEVSLTAIDAGADFIKTSTGKVSVNATLEAAEIMLGAILQSGRNCGFKAAGGIRTVDEAKGYLKLAESILGKEWINAQHFRFGASSLLTNLQAIIANDTTQPTQGY